MVTKSLIFISCGQYTEEEIALGRAVEALVRSETAYEPYFAEQQNSLDGLVGNILSALGRSAAFIGIMHNRGEIVSPSIRVRRGSVWIEQEVAIAAFIQHVLARQLEVALYLQRGISREGLRQQLRLKPVEFDQPEEVLDDLRSRLRAWTLQPVNVRPLIAEWKFDFAKPYDGEHHDYRFEVELVNTGSSVLDQWMAELWFPSQFIAGADRSKPHVVLKLDDTKTPEKRIWPGSKVTAFEVDYYVDRKNWPGFEVEQRQPVVRIRVCTANQPPWEVEIPFMDIQRF
ncbi:MAG TPA: hypothetical protein VE863_07045 [Pyrinomonadaceae bacterium]|jgi:hypothetical protein|nr:hypothetical protein [Pyrinomonadaceae bacterium]